jgi:hypothetical protein
VLGVWLNEGQRDVAAFLGIPFGAAPTGKQGLASHSR